MRIFLLVILFFIPLIAHSQALLVDRSEGTEYALDWDPPDHYCYWGLSGFMSVDYLYWKAYQEGLNKSRWIGKQSKSLHFQWSPGFRLAAGLRCGCSGWDIASFWVHMHFRGGHHPHIRWRLSLDQLDLCIRYQKHLYHCFTIRPFGGLRLAHMDQTLHISNQSFSSPSSSSGLSTVYSFSSASSKSTTCSEAHHRQNRQIFSGLGPLAGLDLDYAWKHGFGLYANAAVSVLYGNFNQKFNYHQKRHSHTYEAIVDLGIGVNWENCLWRGLIMILGIGLEHHSYFNQNRSYSYGNLYFDGITGTIDIKF